jgi:alginate O-acetyltransferase complex protein AlgI
VLFNSYIFITFFALVLLVHSLKFPWRAKKLFLLLASYFFYATWNPPFVVLLWISTLTDWFIARALDRAQKHNIRRILVIASLAVNLGLLGYFKYSAFLLDNFIALMGLLGFEVKLLPASVILPVGISFYTFQTLSYTLDIYFRKARPWHSFLDYALYVTFFPQLVAGPIVRAVDFLPQCIEPKRVSGKQIGWGLTLMLIGMFEKIVVADGLLAPVVERVYNVTANPDFISAWCGTVAFAGQIFCDFAGYSTCAIGVAACLGFELSRNFRFPYAAVGFSDFWRRWHISLSTWLRDYLYIPLGGNRKGLSRTFTNIMITMLLGGLWHGASWTFVIWGGLHGIYLITERAIKMVLPESSVWKVKPLRFILAMLTFALICITWVFFRSANFSQAFEMVGAMFGFTHRESAFLVGRKLDIARVVFVIAILLGLHWIMRDTTLEQVVSKCPWWLRSLIIAGMLIGIVTLSGEDRAFIYFQF